MGYSAGRVVLQTFDKSSLELLHRHMPQVPKVLLLWLGDGGIEPKQSVSFEESGEWNKAAFYAKQEVKSRAEFVRWLAWAKDHGAVGIGAPAALRNGGEQSYMDLVQPWMIRDTHKRGLLAHAYEVDERWDFEKLDSRGVDGFFTNCPSELLRFYGRPSQDSTNAILQRYGY